MSELQQYKLKRTHFVCGIALTAIVGLLTLLTVDILWWQQQLFTWITYENYLPFVGSLVTVSLPFWVAGTVAEIKLRQQG